MAFSRQYLHIQAMRGAAFAAMVLIIAGAAFGQERKCWIDNMVGDVKVRRENSPKWVSARIGLPLKQKDAVRTFVESEATLKTSDGSDMVVGENATLEVDILLQSKDGSQQTNMKIMSGEVVSNVAKLVSKKSKFTFETPTAVASIRGTRVGMQVSGERTDIKVFEGRVYVVPKGSRSGAELGANQMTSVVKGQKTVSITTMSSTEAKGANAAAQTDSGGPAIALITPQQGQVVWPGAEVVVSGKANPAGAVVSVGGKSVKVSSNGMFRATLMAPQEPGEFEIAAEAAYAGQTATATVTVMVNAAPQNLVLTIAAPKNGEIVMKPVVNLSGTVTPGATVAVSGGNVPVGANGNFSKEIYFPEEEGAVTIEIEATLGDEKKVEMLTIEYRPARGDIVLDIQQPVDNLKVCETRVAVSGSVRPSAVELMVNDKRVPVNSGRFMDFVTIPDDPGEHDIEFEVSTEYASETKKRKIIYEPAGEGKCNIDPPMIQPTSLPYSTLQQRLAFTVFDRTPFDEITFYTSVDGSRESETGQPGGQFFLTLEEGVHEYRVYAEDKSLNKSQVASGKVRYMPKTLFVRVRKPSSYEVVHIPPGTPDDAYDAPEYAVSFVVENLPGDNPQLLKEVKVLNQATGKGKTMNTFTDNDFNVDIELKRGRNLVVIEVVDAHERRTTQQVTIELK